MQFWTGIITFVMVAYFWKQDHNGRLQGYGNYSAGAESETLRVLVRSAHGVMFAQSSSNCSVSFVVNKGHGVIFFLSEGQNFNTTRPLHLYTIY